MFRVQAISKGSPYDFERRWDIESVRECLSDADGKLPAFGLERVEIHPSGFCNRSCPHCYGRLLAPTRRRMLSGEAISDLLECVAGDFSSDPVVVFGGLYGEPLVNPATRPSLARAGQLGLRWALYTNGHRIDRDACDLWAGSGAGVGCWVAFDVAAAFTDSREIEAALERIRMLCRARDEAGSALRVLAPVLVSSQDVREMDLEQLQDRLLTAGVDEVRYSRPWAVVDEERRTDDLLDDLIALAPDRVRHRGSKRFGRCYAMSMTATISPEGDVYPCPATASPLYRHLAYGSIHTESFTDIWRGQRHQELFAAFSPQASRCQCCPSDREFNDICRVMDRLR